MPLVFPPGAEPGAEVPRAGGHPAAHGHQQLPDCSSPEPLQGRLPWGLPFPELLVHPQPEQIWLLSQPAIPLSHHLQHGCFEVSTHSKSWRMGAMEYCGLILFSCFSIQGSGASCVAALEIPLECPSCAIIPITQEDNACARAKEAALSWIKEWLQDVWVSGVLRAGFSKELRGKRLGGIFDQMDHLKSFWNLFYWIWTEMPGK